MTMGIERSAKQFEGTHPEVAASLRATAQMARKLGAPEEFLVDVKTSVAAPVEKVIVFPSLDQSVVPYTGKETEGDKPPQEVTDILNMWKEKGITNFDIYHLSAHKFEQKGNYPGWKIKPRDWFWQQIQQGTVSPDAAQTSDMWVAVDKTQKPDYDNGRQLYADDPYGVLLKGLRDERKIKVPKEYKHVPQTSRFAISPDELTQHVLPEIAKILGVGSKPVRLPREIEFNIIGNRSHPEWGNTNTAEWLNDNFGDDVRLIGGLSDDGGLASVRYRWSGSRFDDVGFRPLVVLSSKA